VVAESTNGNGNYALCDEADVCISITGPPIRKVFKFHTLEDNPDATAFWAGISQAESQLEMSWFGSMTVYSQMVH